MLGMIWTTSVLSVLKGYQWDNTSVVMILKHAVACVILEGSGNTAPSPHLDPREEDLSGLGQFEEHVDL